MFCPKCGQQENQNVQYCRQCGADLDAVRSVSLDSAKLGGSGPKHEIARVFASKLENLRTPEELKQAATQILPELDKFLETPEEKKLRRVRYGSVVTLIGLGVAIGFSIVAAAVDEEIIVMAAFGFITFLIGLAMLINGYFFTIPKGRASNDELPQDTQSPNYVEAANTTNDLLMPASARSEFGSVTDHTTRILDEKEIVERDWKK